MLQTAKKYFVIQREINSPEEWLRWAQESKIISAYAINGGTAEIRWTVRANALDKSAEYFLEHEVAQAIINHLEKHYLPLEVPEEEAAPPPSEKPKRGKPRS